MTDTEFLYSHNSALIAAVLFVAMLVCNELSFQIGRYIQHHTDADLKALTGSLQASVLGLLALMLGFTFSMSMQRYNDRSMAVIDEANAIGTAVLRVQLLPPHYHGDARNLFRDYIDLRVAMGKVALSDHVRREEYQQQVAGLQHSLWSMAVAATDEDPRAVTTGAFVQSFNAVIDAQGKRSALQEIHVPEIVLQLQ